MATLHINDETFRRLQKIAVPLLDDEDTLVNKLVDCWENNHKTTTDIKDSPAEFWASARGEQLLVGLKLRASYKGEVFHGEVTKSGIMFSGETFNSPSAAAMRAKNMDGLRQVSTNTNGWGFWEYYNTDLNQWRLLKELRENQQ